jgi:spermidine synthase
VFANEAAMLPSRKSQKVLVLTLFFASGFSGLVYEVVWMRQLSLIFGNAVYASATVLAGFMGGLAIGGFFFGRVADRTPSPLRLYGILELLIGVFALLFPLLLKALLPVYLWYARVSGASYHSLSFAQAVLLVLVLLIPTAFMGGTLPLLIQYLTRETSALGRNLGLLYGLNTAGAVLGCAAAGFILIAAVGIQETTRIAVAVTMLVGVVAIIFSRGSIATKTEGIAERPPDGVARMNYPAWCTRLLLVLLGIAGLTGMAYEVLWTRVLTFLTGTTTYAFTIMLTTYLCGLALGGVVTAWFTDRSQRLLEVFGVLQSLLGLSVLATLGLTPFVLKSLNSLIFHGSAMRFSDFASFILLEGGVSLIFVLPGAILMGMTFPVAAKIYAASRGHAGSGVGVSYFTDTFGAIGGSLLAGFCFIPWFGTLHSLTLLALINMAIGVAAFCCRSGAQITFSAARFGALGLALAVVAFLVRDGIPANTFSGVFVPSDARLTYFDEDIGGTVTIEDYGDHRTISINGVNVAGTDVKFQTTQKLQAHLALLIHPKPEKVLQIGFGSGGTAWAISRHPVKQIDCVEITAAVIKANDKFPESNHGVLGDKRVHVRIDDARSYLVKTDETYDAILSDSIHPRLAGNGGLYCVDYFRLCRKHLNTNGIFSAWLPYYGLSLEDFRVAVRSLKAVFPHVYLFHSPMGRTEWTIILGTLEPLELDVASLQQKMAVPTVADDLKVIAVNRVEDLLDCFLLGDGHLAQFLDGGQTLNTDDFPYLEYIAARSAIRSSREGLLPPIYSQFVQCREDVFPYLTNTPSAWLPDIQKSWESSALVLQARLDELGETTNANEIRKTLQEALQLDPHNNVARNLLEKYLETSPSAMPHK